jgi:hypothetical protein
MAQIEEKNKILSDCTKILLGKCDKSAVVK